MNNNLVFTLRFNANNKQFVGEVNSADKAVKSLGTHSSQTSHEVATLAKETTAATSSFASIKSQLIGVAGGFAALSTAQNAVSQLGRYQDLRTQITALVGGQQEWIETEQYLNQVAEEHNKTLVGMAGNYSRLAVLQEAGVVNQTELRDLFEGMSNAQSQLGASNNQLEQSMYGLSQGLSSSVLHAEELNQVVEPLPGLLNKLDQAAGLPAGGFRQLVNSGQVTSQFFKKTLIDALAKYDGAAAKTANNINAKYAQITRDYQQVVVAFEQPISSSFNTFIDSTSSGLKLLANNADTVSTAVGITLVAATARGTASVVSMAAAQAKKAIVERQAQQQSLALAQANFAENESEIALLATKVKTLQAMQVNNNQKFRAIGASNALAAAQVELGAAEAARTTLLNAETAAQARLNIVTRTGGVVMGLLGGPTGLIMLAASALAYFAMTSETAEDKARKLNGTLDKQVEKYKSLNAAGKEQFMYKLGVESSTARTELIKTQMQIRGVRTEILNASKAGKMATVALKSAELERLQASAKTLEGTVKKTNLEFNKLLTVNTSNLIDPEKVKKTSGIGIPPKSTGKIDSFHSAASSIDVDYKKRLELRTAAQENQMRKVLGLQLDYSSQSEIEEKYAYAQRKESLQKSYKGALTQAKANNELKLQIKAEFQEAEETLEEDHQVRLNEIHDSALIDSEKVKKTSGIGIPPKNHGKIDSFNSATSSIDADYKKRLELRTAAQENQMRKVLGLQLDYASQSEIEEKYAYAQRQESLQKNYEDALTQARANNELKLQIKAEFHEAEATLEQDHQLRLDEISDEADQIRLDKIKASKQQQLMNYSSFVGGLGNVFGQLNQLAEASGKHSKLLFFATKAIAIAQGIVNTELASINAMAFSGAKDVAGMLVSKEVIEGIGYASVGIIAGTTIAGQAHDGIGRVPKSNEGTWMLRQDEMVLNPTQTDNFEWMVSMMQQMKSTYSAMTSGAPAVNQSNYKSGVVVNIHTTEGTTATTEQSTVDGQTQLDVYIEQAVKASMSEMYKDADNGGPVSTRIRAG